MDSLARGTGSGGNVLRTEFLIETGLESGDFSCGVLVHMALWFFKWVSCHGSGRVRHHGEWGSSAMLGANTRNNQ